MTDRIDSSFGHQSPSWSLRTSELRSDSCTVSIADNDAQVLFAPDSWRESTSVVLELMCQLFYATFDPKLGPCVVHQVPENLITSSSTPEESRSRSVSRSRERSQSPFPDTLLDFAPISDYVIPKKSLHGKLVNLLSAGRDEDERTQYRIMGFPSVLTGGEGQYERNEYMWNLCFVFLASSSLEAFEPVVRKCGRILRSAEVGL